MTDQFYSLINLPQTGSLKKEVVNYDEQTLKDALNYLTTRDAKPTLQRWIRTELATRSRVRGNTRYSKGFTSTSWAIKWGKEWDEARTDLNPDARWYDDVADREPGTGYWEKTKVKEKYLCSTCREKFKIQSKMGIPLWRFCPVCGSENEVDER